MTFSSLSKIINKAAVLCTSERKVTSRILRRSQITALWQRNDDPGWRSKVATQCGHSLATASRYYEFSEKNNSRQGGGASPAAPQGGGRRQRIGATNHSSVSEAVCVRLRIILRKICMNVNNFSNVCIEIFTITEYHKPEMAKGTQT